MKEVNIKKTTEKMTAKYYGVTHTQDDIADCIDTIPYVGTTVAIDF